MMFLEKEIKMERNPKPKIKLKNEIEEKNK